MDDPKTFTYAQPRQQYSPSRWRCNAKTRGEFIDSARTRKPTKMPTWYTRPDSTTLLRETLPLLVNPDWVHVVMDRPASHAARFPADSKGPCSGDTADVLHCRSDPTPVLLSRISIRRSIRLMMDATSPQKTPPCRSPGSHNLVALMSHKVARKGINLAVNKPFPFLPARDALGMLHLCYIL